MQRCEDNVAARLNGNALQPLSDVSVTVTDDHTGLPAALYSDNGVTQVFQPLKTDDNGYYGFYAANGEYTLTFSGIRIATFKRKVVLNDFDDNPAVTKAELAAGSGASLVTFTQLGTGAAPVDLQALLRDSISVRQFGAQGGAHDDSNAIQAAIDAALPNQAVRLFGRHNCGKSLTFSKAVTIIGSDARNSNLPDWNTSSSVLVFTNAANGGLIGTGNLCLSDLVLVSAADYGVSLTDASLVTKNVVIQGATSNNVRIVRGYYNKFINTRLCYGGSLGAYFDNCYAISASGLSIHNTPASLYLTNGSTMTMHAGSIEDYGTGADGATLQAGSALNLFGTYFEGNPAGGGTRGVSLGVGCSVNAIGCHVYANTMARWITVEGGSALGARVFSRCNKLVLPEDGFATEIYSLLSTDGTGYCDIAGDNWLSSAGANAKYVGTTFTGGTGPVSNVGCYSIQYPANHPLHGRNINTNPMCAAPSRTTPTVSDGTILPFLNQGFDGVTDDPLGLHSKAWGYNGYSAIFQKGQWEKVGLRIPTIASIATADATDLATAITLTNANKAKINAILTALAAAGVML